VKSTTAFRILFISLLIGISEQQNAQTINLSDSLYRVLLNKPTPTFKFDTRNSFITGNQAKVYGLKAGLSFRKTLTIGIGYNFIGTRLTEELVVGRDVYYGQIKMRYIAPFLEYSFYKKGPWEAMVPVQFGVGQSFVRYDVDGVRTDIRKDNIILYEPGMNIEYKIFNVLGIGGGVGYRIMLKNNREIKQQFTSPVYVIRIRLIFDEILRQARENKWITDPLEEEQ
jgi:hypothetical protein